MHNSIVHFAESDLLTIESHDLPSGFHGVYPKGDSWCAKPWKSYHLGSTYRTPRHAARAVVSWWQRNFGDKWRQAYEIRREKPWSVSRQRAEPDWPLWSIDGTVSYGERGYRLFVWELGRKICVPPPQTDAILFVSRQSAERYFERWSRDRYGLFVDCYVTPFPDFIKD